MFQFSIMMLEIALLWCHPFVTQAAEGNTGLISYPIAPGYLSLKAQLKVAPQQGVYLWSGNVYFFITVTS